MFFFVLVPLEMTDCKDDHFWPLILLLLLMWETDAELGGLLTQTLRDR